ncbi:TipJ family phage tail tip protein [Acinetobacter baumannii]|uniref:TipJ family phage tail tip protein n=3 Tax=Acinetobacter baumannii TaxID=470 RepID=UPI0021C6AA38|nr:phage tail protein [Acinetobacter baumannii]
MAKVIGAKKGDNKARQPVIAPDSAQSKTFIKILYGLAEGEVEGLANGNQSIFLEETPLQDANGNLSFSNVKVDFRKGTNDQDYIDGFPAIESETAVGVELKSGIPWVRAFSNIDLDAVRIRLKWGPLRSQDATTGDVSGLTIEYAIDLQTDGGSWIEVLKTKISDKTSANYERAHRIDLPKADSGWIVRVRRITPNSTSEYVSDKMYVEAVTEVVDAKLRYPNTALLGLQYDAETFGNVAKVAVDLKGTLLLVPSNYNAQTRQYIGIWDGTFKRAYSNNPAWIYYDLCTNDRYGLGDRLTPLMIDKWSLYRLAQYCDQMVSDGLGGEEPRFTCNVYLQSASEAFSILTKLAGVFRAIAFWDGANIHCDADIPQDTYFTYTRANVIGGQFEYSGTRARDRHNVVKVAWDNPANHYKTEYEFVRDEQAIAESGQVRILELDAWGCTSRGQAQRAGHWALKSEQKETRTVSFKVGLDGHIPLPGRVIEIADELFAGRANGGRVSKISADLTKITLDRDDVVAKAGDRLVINGENGKAQTRIVQSISGRVVKVTLPFDENSIAVQNVWVLDAQDLATMKFRVISISQDEKHQFSITALQYNPQKFDEIDNGAFFEEAPISIVNPSIQEPVKDVLITTESRVDQGINVITMIVSWTQAKGAVKYLVEWRKDDGSWIRLPLTGNNSVEVPGVYSGQYQARVTAISAFEVASLPTSSILTDITGKQGLPPKLAFIRATGILFGMKLDWGFPPTGAKDTAYTEIEVSTDGINNIAQLGLFAYPTTTTTIQGLQPNLRQFYRGRLIDRIGNVGPWSEWVNGTTTADPEAVLDLISGHIGETDLAKELQTKIENTVNVSEAAAQAAANAQTAASNAQEASKNAQASAEEAKSAATEAKAAATDAQVLASEAEQVANEASAIAANAKNAADQAVSSAITANTAAAEAKTTASNANTTATNAQTAANDAAAAASKVASDLTTSTNQLNQKIADETKARTTAISNLNDGLTTETSQRKSEDAALLSNIETYKSSTNGTLSSLQTQINTNATNTSANASKITSLDSRLTTNEGKTAEAINAAATAQQTANTAVNNAAAAASAVTALKSELSTGKGINNIIAPFSDPQELSPYIIGASRTVALVKSPMRIKGNAYDVTFNAVAGSIYFGSSSLATVNTAAAGIVSGGKRYMLSAYLKNLDATKQADVYFTLHWFKRAADGTFTSSQSVLLNQSTNNTRVTPSNDGGTISCKAVAAPPDAVAFAVICSGNGVYNVAGSRILIDMLMLEEVVGVDVPASTWTAGPTDLSAIKSALDANASAISKIDTRVTNAEGTISSQGNSITQLNNSVTSINGELTKKADATALNALTNRVSTAEGTISSQGNSITSLRNDLNATNDKVSSKADSSALNSLDSKVTSIDGRVTSNTSAVTSLQGRVSTVEAGLSSKADASALSNYYTKTEADAATSGAINSFNSQLTIGGVNVVANSEAPRTSTAATNKEYLLYERSAELKAFYDENLDKPITISFEMSVPVVGSVQVYSSNGSAHTFATNVNAVIANQFIKYAVTVTPKAHTASTTVSTIEFYGTYGTGRIPTIRKLQIEAGTKATAWSPSPRDTKAAIDANASAIQTTQTKVDNIDGRLTTATDSITSLGSRMTTAEGNITGTNNAVNGLSTRMATAEGKITNQSDSITSLQNSVSSINSTLANKADSSAVSNLTSRVTAAEGNITSQSGQIATLNNSLTTTNNTLNDVNALARLLSLGKPLRDDPTFKTTSSGGLSAYVFPAGTSWVKQAKSTDNPTDSTSEMLIRATQALGGGWYPTAPTLVLTANKTFLIKQIIKMPVGTKLLAVGNATGTGGYIKILGNDLGTGKFETYYTVVQGGTDVANTIQGHNRVVNAANPPVPSTTSPVDVILASYEVFDVTAVNDTIPKAYSDSIAANASAISNLTNSVTQQGNTITSHSNSITQLNNSITSINGSLSNKADASALQSLDSKVTLIDGKVTSNSSALTALQSSFDGLPNQGVNLLGPEISNPVEKPNWISGLPFEVIQSPDTVNVRAFQFTMPANASSGTYFNIGGGQVPRQWLTEGTYIFSFVAKTVGGTPPYPIDWVMYNVSTARQRFNITETLTRYSAVFTVPAGGAAACMLLYGNPAGKPAGQVINIERMMLERQVGTNTTPSTWIAGSDPTGMIISTQAKATDLFNTATNQNSATANRVTSLESRMTTTEGNLTKKADASALQNLDTKVSNIDGKVTSNTNAITALSSTLSNATSSISMNAGNALADWTFFNTLGEYSIVAQADGQAGRVIQLGNNAGNDIVWMHPNNFIPFDATKTYRLRARYRRRAGTGTIYLGVSQKTPDKAQYVTTANALSNDMGSSNYVVNAHAPAIDEWQEIVAYIKGRSAGAASGSGSKTSPRTVSQQAGFITPMFIANYSAQTGIVELDYLILEDAEAIAGNDANATAISTLDTKVSDIDGRLTTATNSITSLGSRMNTAEGNISAANTALSGLSTRMTSAENSLTNQSNAITNLSNSLTATTNTANAALPKIQGGTGAAKLFRGVLVWQQNGVNLTGNIVIQTPITFTNKMFRLALSGYNYLAGKNEINLNIGGYAYTGTSLLQHGVVNSGTMPIRVRMGVRNGTVVIILTSQAPGAYWQYPKFNLDAEIGYTTPPDDWINGWSASLVAEADLVSNGISAIIEPSLLDISTEINANASAISSLSNTVTQQGNTITSHSNSITSLNNSITSINSSLTNKADASALNNLSNRVTAAEGNITSQGNSITSLNNTLTNNDLSNLVLNPDFVDPKSGWTSGVIVDATDAAPNPPSPKALKLNNRDSYYGPFVKCNVGDMFYVSAWFATPNTSATASAVIGFNTRNSAGTYTWYTVAVKSTDKNAWGLVEGYFTVPAGMVDIRPWLQVSIAASEAAGQQWHVTNIQVRNITGNKKLATDLQATSSALSTLDSKVANIDGRVTSASNSIVSLNNSVTNINTALSQKADATALNSLSNRVTTAEGNITSQGNSITSLNNTLTNNDLSNLVLNPDFVDPKSGWTSGVIVDATDAAPNPPSPKALKLNNRDSYYGPFVKCNVGDMFYVSAWFATPNTSATASAVIGFNTRNSAGTYTWYTVAVKSTDKNAWGLVEGYFTVPAGMVDIRPWLQVSIAASEAAGQQWHVTNIQVRNITGNKKLATDLQATSSALSTLDSKVANIDGRVTSASNSIVSLNNSVTNINTALSQKADATALNSLSNRVTTAEGNITSQGNAITSLTNSLAVSGKGGTNLLIKSNVVGTYNGTAYPHHVYEMGEDWEVGAKYTLIWCAEHARGTGDGSSYLSVYAGGGSQSLQSIVNTGGKVVNKTTFTKSTAGTGKVINFYMINRPTADKGSVGTVYWAVLVKGDVLTTDAWIPSTYDYIPDSNANASAITNLTNTVTQQGNTLTSHTNSITSLNNSITSINGVLNTKANTSAVSDLDSRVTDAEGKITANTSSITSLTANLKNVANGITMSASLDVDPDSEWNYRVKNGEVARADDASALGGKVYRFGNNAGNDYVNVSSKAKLPFDQTKTYRIRARYRRLNGTGTIYCAVCCLAADGISHVNSSNTVSSDFGSSNYFVINQSPANNVWQEVTVYVKGRSTGAATGSWTLAAPRQMPNATAFLSVQFLANYSSAAGEVDLDYLIIEDADAIAANDATANALSSLDTRVITAEGKITSQGNSITQLNNSITTINGTLSSKADSSALNSLANRVSTAEGAISSQGSSITSLNSSVTGILKDIEVTDSRSTNQPPSWYWSNYPKRIVREFKQASTIGLSGMGTYVSLETYVYYSDATGGPIIQIARGTDSKLTAERRSTSTSTWGTWVQDIKAISDGLANKAEASALSSLDSKVSVIDGKVSTQASSITTLQTTVGGNTASIQSQQQSIDGLKARATLKLQSGNLVGGVGIENDSKTVDFIIQANRFAIGAPSDVTGTVTPKYAFAYQSTPTTLPNGTVIPAGLYLDNASIGYINASRIWADNLSAISADLGTIKVKNANIEDGAIDTLKIKDEAVTVPIGVKAIDVKTITTFAGGVTSGQPNNDFNNHLAAWENHIGTLLQVTLNRSGGKVRLDASVNICTPTFGAFSVSDGRGNPIAANDRAMASFYISIYKNGSLIGRGSLGANIETGNINVNFNGTAVIVSAIDDNSTIGNVTYTLKAGFARQEGVNIPLNVESRSNFMITSRTLSVIEMKK